MNQDNAPQLIYGRNPVLEAIQANIDIDKVYIHNTLRGEFEIQVRKECKRRTIPLVKVPDHKLQQQTQGANHQGIMAFISPIRYLDLEDIIDDFLAEEKPGTLVFLDGVTDTRNLGAIARSAVAFDISCMILPIKKSSGVTEDAIKASAGALLSIKLCRVKNMQDAIQEVQKHGIRVYASSLTGDSTLEETDLVRHKGIVLGAESRGVSREIQSLTDGNFKIEQSENMESLNVSVAAGIIFRECYQKSKNSK